MATNIMAVDQISKHLTNAEKIARINEQNALSRKKIHLKAPDKIKEDECAMKYWTTTIKRTKGLGLLDDLDTDMLAAYCKQSAMRDKMIAAYDAAVTDEDALSDPIKMLCVMANAADAMRIIQAQERVILTYAGKLGLTADSRARLAKKRAEEKPKASPFERKFGNV